MQVTVHHAKTHLSKLLADVERGEEVVIARGATPVARLVPVNGPAQSTRGYGVLRDKVRLTSAFFEPLPDDELAAWNGE